MRSVYSHFDLTSKLGLLTRSNAFVPWPLLRGARSSSINRTFHGWNICTASWYARPFGASQVHLTAAAGQPTDSAQYETFRLYPGVALITKMCKSAQEVRVFDKTTDEPRDVTLPAECRVYLSAPGVHYHPKYWPEPWELRPERWMAQGRAGKNTESERLGRNVVAADKTRQMRGSLLTFSDGSRACLGRKFAQAEFVAFFAVILQRFEVQFEPGTDVEQVRRDLNFKSAGTITMSPVRPFPLTLRERAGTPQE